MNARSRFFGDAVNLCEHLWVFVMDHAGKVTAVVQYHVAIPWRAVFENCLLDTPLAFFVRLAFPRINSNARSGDTRSGVVLCREDVARRPAYFGAKLNERFDQHGGLYCHVDAADDFCAGEWTLCGVFFPQRHQRRHLCFGECDFTTTKIGE